MQISKFLHDQPAYPAALREIASPPSQLYVLGTLPEAVYVAIVGSRSPTAYGQEFTYKLAFELAQAGICIVSGLALGLDAVAHRAAIDAGGKTVAVLPLGLNKIYPSRHRDLALKILSSGGALVSEHPEGDYDPQRFNFPQRNRIIAGLACGIIVTEASEESGSLITARFGLNSGRTVMAVPGQINHARAVGPNNLIREGAILIRDTNDVFEAINSEIRVMEMPVKAKSAEEARLIELIKEGVHSADGLIQASGLSAPEFANIMTLMEITGKINNLGAGQWTLRSSKASTKKSSAKTAKVS